jgi:hypothetical protein
VPSRAFLTLLAREFTPNASPLHHRVSTEGLSRQDRQGVFGRRCVLESQTGRQAGKQASMAWINFRRRLVILTDQDPNSFIPFSLLDSGVSPLIYPHPLLSPRVTRSHAMHTLLGLISSVLADTALLHPPVSNTDDLVPHWPLIYPYIADRQHGGCMEFSPQKVKAMERLDGVKRLWLSKKRSLSYLELHLGYGVRSNPNRKKPCIMSSIHRLIYWCFYGPFSGQVLHDCGNNLCINPNHLKVGDHRQNWEDWAMCNY